MFVLSVNTLVYYWESLAIPFGPGVKTQWDEQNSYMINSPPRFSAARRLPPASAYAEKIPNKVSAGRIGAPGNYQNRG